MMADGTGRNRLQLSPIVRRLPKHYSAVSSWFIVINSHGTNEGIGSPAKSGAETWG